MSRGYPKIGPPLHSEICGSLICAIDLKVKKTKFRPKNSTNFEVRPNYDGFGGLVVSMLASGTRVRGFDPGQSRWIFPVR
jgi:hypothetical protein